MRRSTMIRIGTALAVAAITVPLGSPASAAPGAAVARVGAHASAEGAAPDGSKLLLVLDASGSMKKPDPSGLTKIEAAKQALTSVVTQLPEDSTVGLRVYGATVDSKGKPTRAACADTQLVTPVGPLDRPALTAAIKRFTAVGETPIAHSLEQGLDDLGDTGKRTIVLVSDGQESCVPDPCPVVRKLVGAGVDLRIDTVGFAVDAKARKQLKCVAAAGNGTYYDAADAERLTESLTRISVRAAREFGTSGTRANGTPVASGAPTLTPGQYVDEFTTGEGPRHYLLARSIPNSTLHVSVVARPAIDLEGSGESTEIFRFNGFDEDGHGCENPTGMAGRIGLSSLFYPVSGSISIEGGTAEEPGPCGAQMQVPLEISRDEGSTSAVDAEMLVIEEPPVTNLESLPAPAEKPDVEPSQLGKAAPVIGGTSFSGATPITPGTWTEEYVSGETIYYRFPVAWGQTVKVTAGPVLPETDTSTGPLFDANLYDPTRGNVGVGSLGVVGEKDARAVRQSAEVRYRNREDFPIRFSSLAGQYFLAVSLPRVDEGSTVPMKVTFRLEVTGEPSGEPVYASGSSPAAASSLSPAVSPTPTETAGSTPVMPPPDAVAPSSSTGFPSLAAGAALLVALVVAAAVAVTRRRSSSTG